VLSLEVKVWATGNKAVFVALALEAELQRFLGTIFWGNKGGRMKIAMTSLYLPGGSKIGVGYQVHHMANQLVQRGHAVTVFSQCAPGREALYQAHVIEPGKRWRTFGFAWDLREVDFSGFDVLHAHGDDWFLWGKRRPRHVHTYHGSCLAESGHQVNLRERIRMLALAACEYGSLGLCDASVAVSEGTRAYIPGIRHVIPNGVELDRFYPSTEKAERPTCLFVGAIKGRKRGSLLVDIFQKVVLAELPMAELWVVCDEPVEGDGIQWFGRVSTNHLSELYRKAWVFCLPSSYEGFGVPYIEAMASGTAVVATGNRGALEVLQNGTCGIISGEDRLGRRLVQVLRDSRLRKFLERAGLQRAQSFGWDTVCKAYEALYRGEACVGSVPKPKEVGA
jgi:glycosyltransferase involved in cell wall biosynthesis